MAALSDADRFAIWAELMQMMSDKREETDIRKGVLRNAVDSADDWIEANFTSYNNSLPVSIQNKMNKRQRMRILWLVISAKYRLEE
jgi:hypothetical protein